MDPREHWAFQGVNRPLVPPGEYAHPIDALLEAGRLEHGLTAQPEASRLTLVRRLYMDLIGMPPGPGELRELLSDDSPGWYAATVERLLSDPRHGERWGRHWMDVWRYSDWWGLGDQLRNSQKHIWHWRDWIVESLNEDVPYDEMIRQMLAADELYPNDLDKLRGSGYLARSWFIFNRNHWMEDTIEHVGKGFLGLTFNCAKCHNHKFDPIQQADFYKLRAFFEPYHVRLDMVPGTTDLVADGIPRPFDGFLDAETYLFVRGNDKHPDKSQANQTWHSRSLLAATAGYPACNAANRSLRARPSAVGARGSPGGCRQGHYRSGKETGGFACGNHQIRRDAGENSEPAGSTQTGFGGLRICRQL